jgi:RNA polymerase sigma-70 factor (family 1)
MKISYETFSDHELITSLKQGDSLAFNEIFKRFQSLLFLFTNRRLNDPELSKDLIHDLFTELWAKRSKLEVPISLEAFLITVIKNRILNHFKHQKVSQRYLDNFDQYLEKNDISTDYLIRHNELASLIEKEIAALPEKMRIVFVMSRKKNMTRKEIAEELQLSEETVKSRMRHAISVLKDKLGVLLIFAFL